MAWWAWVLIIYFVLQSQQRTNANSASVAAQTQQTGYTGGFGINLIF